MRDVLYGSISRLRRPGTVIVLFGLPAADGFTNGLGDRIDALRTSPKVIELLLRKKTRLRYQHSKFRQ